LPRARVEAFGRKAPSPLLNSDRGGAIPIPTQDPLAAREAAQPYARRQRIAVVFDRLGEAVQERPRLYVVELEVYCGIAGDSGCNRRASSIAPIRPFQ
jgi:hypothetical protein